MFLTSRLLRFSVLLLPVVMVVSLMSIAHDSFADSQAIVSIAADQLSDEAARAQTLALESRQLRRVSMSERSEVFHVLTLSRFRPNQRELCADVACYQVDIYDYTNRSTTTLIVDTTNERVLDSWQVANSHPVYSNAAGERAKELLLTSDKLAAALGRSVHRNEIALMQGEHANVDACDGLDMCLTAVFVVDSGMVWATVNMQRDEVAAIWWTERPLDGADAAKRAWEDAPQVAPTVDCGDTFSHSESGWEVNYEVTNSDGLYAYDIRFNDEVVVESVKLVEWHVDYTVQNNNASPSGFVDFVTCNPFAPSGKILAFEDPYVQPITATDGTTGFEIVQDFRQTFWGFTCRYRYDQRYQFFSDGRFRTVAGGYGRGCGNQQLSEALYRAVMRIDFPAGANGEQFEYWNGDGWTEQTTEAWFGDNKQTPWDGHNADHNGYAFRVHSGSRGYYIEPGVGQFGDGGTGDRAWVYVSKYAASEGAADLGAFGSTFAYCCNDSYEQGPELFLNNETISGEDNVIWYATDQATVTEYGANPPPPEEPRADAPYCWTSRDSSNNPTTEYPCFAGPMFVPIGREPTAVNLLGGNSAELDRSFLFFGTMLVLMIISGWQWLRLQRLAN